jgi:hypothetical protein
MTNQPFIHHAKWKESLRIESQNTKLYLPPSQRQERRLMIGHLDE